MALLGNSLRDEWLLIEATRLLRQEGFQAVGNVERQLMSAGNVTLQNANRLLVVLRGPQHRSSYISMRMDLRFGLITL